MWTTNKLKQAFHDYFKQKGHIELPSSNVIPNNDPTLLFTNSGMVQFKNIFLGEKPKYKRVTTSQHCIRAGGKHNDLEDVGKDNYHHTFFEMLGNWSFGDYFKKEAIQYAYEFLVDILKIDPERLYVTVYDEMDSDSREIWKKYLPEDRIIGASMKDNFWEMGEFGPCGPCTEIHYDRIGGRNASHLVNMDDPNVLEIWNIVFMEYERTPKGLIPMEEKKIDTGIGLERLLSILMNVKSNYLIDSFQEIIKFTESKCNFIYNDKECQIDMAFRVIADHARTMAICIHDGVGFSNEGAGYVQRRILRRAVRYADDVLKIETGILSKIVEIAANTLNIMIDVTVVDIEENMFRKTLKRGLAQFNKIVESKNKIDSEDIFLLYDAYGFPEDLTRNMAEERNIEISTENFEKLKEEAKEKSRSKKESPITLNFTFEKTEDKFKYFENDIEATLQCVVLNNEIVDGLEESEKGYLIFNKTCFYSESGGQVGDSGLITFLENGTKVGYFDVIDCKNVRGFIVHAGYLRGNISKKAILHFDEERRILIRNNHSAIHILTRFLKEFVKGGEQLGSYVDEFKGTYDFASKKMSENDLSKLEDRMNDFVKSGANVEVLHIKSSEMDDSINYLKNAEYPEIVRVIKMDNGIDLDKALCGGTHVSNTSVIGSIRIINESGVGVNLRRITIVSGKKAQECEENAIKLLEEIKKGNIVKIDCPISAVDRVKIESKNKELIKKKVKLIASNVDSMTKEIEEIILLNKIEKVSILNNNSKFIKYSLKFDTSVEKKDISKASTTVGSVLVKENAYGCVFYQLENEVFISAFVKDPELKIKSMNFSNNLRVSRDLIQGIIDVKFFEEFLTKIQ